MLFLVKSNLVKLATSRTVILPPTVSALCCVNRKRLRVSIVVVESLCKREKEGEREMKEERERDPSHVSDAKKMTAEIFLLIFFKIFPSESYFLTGRPAAEQAPKLPKIFFKRTN